MSNYTKQNFEYDAVVKKQKLINMDNALEVLNEDIVNIVNSLMTGVNLSGKDFNNLGNTSIVGTGNGMTNDPINNSSAIYIVQHICAKGMVTQYAKPINWGGGELLYFRQFNGTWGKWIKIITDAQVVDNLESTLTNVPLSANQGRVINESIRKTLINTTQAMDSEITINANTIHSITSITVPANSYAIITLNINNRSGGNPTIAIGTATDSANMTISNRTTVEQYSSMETTILIDNTSSSATTKNIVIKPSAQVKLQYISVRGFIARY
jgi:hypothetical protein